MGIMVCMRHRLAARISVLPTYCAHSASWGDPDPSKLLSDCILQEFYHLITL